jgi:hypothetical protein
MNELIYARRSESEHLGDFGRANEWHLVHPFILWRQRHRRLTPVRHSLDWLMTSYHLNYGAFRALVLNAPWMVAEMESHIGRAFSAAEAISPVDEGGPHPGRYRASFRVRSGTNGGIHHDRAFAELSNDSPEAVYVEWGNGHEGTAQHVLQRAIDSL